METTGTELPPLGKISMIGIWVETVLYGINCVMYGLCMFVLLRGGKTRHLHWVLIMTSTIFFLLCTVHVGASLQQLLNAFVYAPTDVPDYSIIYWRDLTTTLRVLKDNVYDTLVIAQYFVLIWRLYVVFMCDWRVVVLPIILAFCDMGSVYASSAVSALSSNGLYGLSTTSLIISGWILGLVINISITGAIVVRLWWMGRTLASLLGTSTNRFASSIHVVIESGVISAVCSIIVLVLFVSKSPASLTSLDVITQLAVLNPLLIVVQVGRTGGHHVPEGDSLKMTPTTLDEMRFRAGPELERDSLLLQDPQTLDSTLARSLSSVHAHV